MIDQGYINHVTLVLDASLSMKHLEKEVIKVVDNQITYLASRSVELNQETRITVYTFDEKVECLIYDKDVLRIPSISAYYRPKSNTALVDATIRAIDELSLSPELYGDHAFLVYIITDGEDNRSKKKPGSLSLTLNALPDNWTVAVMVPDQNGVFHAKQFGFPKDNIAIWDATSAKGLSEAGDVLRQTTDSFMAGRAHGIRGTKSLFDMASLTKNEVVGVLTEVHKSKYKFLDVGINPAQISDFVKSHGYPYHLGVAFYPLTKREEIQAHKKICVVEKKTKKVFTGQEARNLLGLPSMSVRVSPQDNPNFDIFVQSTSVNRKLVPGTKLLVMP